MSAYPPPPGLNNSSAPSSSLPARPPPSAAGRGGFKPAFQPQGSANPNRNVGGAPQGFTGFAPRAIASTGRPHRPSGPTVSSGPQSGPGYSAQPTYASNSYQAGYQQQSQYSQGYQNSYAQQSPLQIRNPFAPPTAASAGPSSAGGYAQSAGADPDMEAQIAQWQSAYVAKDDGKATQKPASAAAGPSVPAVASSHAQSNDAKAPSAATGKPLTVERAGGGQKWSDSSLLEWDPAHFRIFVGNLAGEVTDDSLLKAFARYPSVQKARVIRDKLTTKSKGFGFVSFSDGDDYFKAARDMNNKYIGSHPVKIKKSTTEIKPVAQKDHRHNNKKNGKGGNKDNRSGSTNPLGPSGGGISKKQNKTKGGLKIIG